MPVNFLRTQARIWNNTWVTLNPPKSLYDYIHIFWPAFHFHAGKELPAGVNFLSENVCSAFAWLTKWFGYLCFDFRWAEAMAQPSRLVVTAPQNRRQKQIPVGFPVTYPSHQKRLPTWPKDLCQSKFTIPFPLHGTYGTVHFLQCGSETSVSFPWHMHTREPTSFELGSKHVVTWGFSFLGMCSFRKWPRSYQRRRWIQS